MNRYDIALKKPVPKRYVKKFLTKLKYWWSINSAILKNKLRLILRLMLRRPSFNSPQINYPTIQGTTGPAGAYTGYGYGSVQGITGTQGYYTGIQGTTGIQGITGTWPRP